MNSHALVVSNLTTASGVKYFVQPSLGVGQQIYVNKPYTFTSVPVSLQGHQYIQTSNGDKTHTDPAFLSFVIDEPATVYLAYDVRLPNPPLWLSLWENTSEQIVTTDTTLRLFRKVHQAGPIMLGGNHGVSASSMYSVILVPLDGEDMTPPDVPTNLIVS